MKSKYRVVRIDNGRANHHTGVVSGHKTLDAAQSAIDRANRRLRRGSPRAWHPFAIEVAVPVSYTDGSTGVNWARQGIGY